MEYSVEKLDKLHSVLVELLDYVDKVCKENNLEYLLIGGTALGAKRHKGFIPWDDDVDIALPREDYDELIKIMKGQEGVYSIQNEDNEENYFCPFIKLRKSGTVFCEKISVGLYKNNGIYIDIFPIDTMDECESVGFKMDMFRLKMMNHALRFGSCKALYKEKNSFLGYVREWIMYIPYSFFSNYSLLKNLRKIMIKRNRNEKRFAANFAGTNTLDKEIMDYDVFFPCKMITFENKEYPGPNRIEQYLEHLYGDYMKLPPENKRHTHEPLELKF